MVLSSARRLRFHLRPSAMKPYQVQNQASSAINQMMKRITAKCVIGIDLNTRVFFVGVNVATFIQFKKYR